MSEPQIPQHAQVAERHASQEPPQPLSAEPLDGYDEGFDDVLPLRPRTRYLTPLTALLMALLLGGVGFYAGVRLEKSRAAQTGSRAAAALGGASGSAKGGKHRRSSRAGAPGRGLAAGFAGAGGGGRGGVAGSVSGIAGDTLYVTEASGNTVAVKLSSATRITKNEPVSRSRIFPGDRVAVTGSGASKGTVEATSVTDSGAGGGGSGKAAGSGSGSAAGASSAISSLFGGG